MYNRSYINSDGQCLSICFYGYGKNTATSTCDKCSSLSKYIESTGVGCVGEPTVPYILIDPYNNIFELCFLPVRYVQGKKQQNIIAYHASKAFIFNLITPNVNHPIA